MSTKLKTTLFCLFLIAVLYSFGSYLIDNKHQGQYISSDAEGYYMYLSAVFITGTFENLPVLTPDHFPKFPGTEKVFTKYTYGVAFFEMPFFLAAYLSRSIQGLDPDLFFAADYSVALLMTGCVYGVLGLFFLFKTLVRELADRRDALLTGAVLLLGTNLLFYMVREPGMSHVYSFFLVSLLLYLTPVLYSRPTWATWLGIGFLVGFIGLIRPTNLLVLLYPMFYGITSWEGVRERLQFFKTNWVKIVSSLLPVMVVWLPQMYYWHYLTGDWLFYPYTHEGFHLWKKPQILLVLAGPLNGWLTYNPVLLFALAGMPFLLKRNRYNGVAIAVIFVVSLYLFASWWMWWFGGAYGYRSFVDLLPLLAVPLCFAVGKIKGMAQVPKIFLFSLMVLCCLYNLRLISVFSWDWSHHFFDWAKFAGMLKDAFLTLPF